MMEQPAAGDEDDDEDEGDDGDDVELMAGDAEEIKKVKFDAIKSEKTGKVSSSDFVKYALANFEEFDENSVQQVS